jgi:ABC-2 type transport system permease protein
MTPGPNLPRIYLLEFRNEFLKLLRLPVFAISTIAFPVMFYVLFASIYGSQTLGSVSTAVYMLATYGTFGMLGASLFGFGVGVATERGQGWMILKRASPMPPAAYFAAKLGMALVFGALTVLALFAAGWLLSGIRLPPATWLSLFGVLLAGAVPFCALGLALGYLSGPNSAPVVINLLYMPMAFLSGLWLPLPLLPASLQAVAPFLPAYHYSQLALKVIGADRGGSTWLHFSALAGFTLVFLAAALLLFRRDEGKTFG